MPIPKDYQRLENSTAMLYRRQNGSAPSTPMR